MHTTSCHTDDRDTGRGQSMLVVGLTSDQSLSHYHSASIQSLNRIAGKAASQLPQKQDTNAHTADPQGLPLPNC